MDKTYKQTRVRLTLLYFAILCLIVAFFSVIIINNQFDQIERIAQYRQSEINQRILPPIAGDDSIWAAVISDVKASLLLRIIETDAIIILISLIASYYLAGKTLKPIEIALQKQRQFIADASHELKTPLTAIMTQAEVLLKADRNSEQYKNFTQSVLEEGQRLTQLTTQLLDIAKSDNQKQKMIYEDIEINAWLASVIDTFESLAAKKHIGITCIPAHEEILLSTDKRRLTELIDILLDNAVKYNKDGGELRIAVQQTSDAVVISIKDSGIGIAQEHINKIFDRFYQVAQDRHTKGFGLGLSIAKEITRELGINMHFDSILQQGTTVTLTIPASKK